MAKVQKQIKVSIPQRRPELCEQESKFLQSTLDDSLLEQIQWLYPDKPYHRVLRKSIDARTRHSPHMVYSLELSDTSADLSPSDLHLETLRFPPKERVLIVGSGPAGLFAALRLCEQGIPCTLFERGSESEKRIRSINRYWRYGELDPRNNVCFGEGGAGLYSDGKLITRIKSPYISYVMNRLVSFGAPSEIEYLSNPHVGSDKIRRVIPKLRQKLLSLGCHFHFDTQVTELIFDSSNQFRSLKTEHGAEYFGSHVILATGHSAEDMLLHLRDLGVTLEPKGFAMGLRIEHPQDEINKIQWREFHDHPLLGAANYKLTHHDHGSGLGVYSFCMCPGGFVLSSGTEADGLVCNGMSNYNRNSPYANAALVVTVPTSQGSDLWSGMRLRRELENRAYLEVFKSTGSGRALPAQKTLDFLHGKNNSADLKGSSPSGLTPVNFEKWLPPELCANLKKGLVEFEKKMKGFLSPSSILYGVETRTSCPVRVLRSEETLQSVSHPGLYPAGEGAGYAGGITSAACDGIRIADKIYFAYASQSTSKALEKT